MDQIWFLSIYRLLRNKHATLIDTDAVIIEILMHPLRPTIYTKNARIINIVVHTATNGIYCI